MIVEAGRNGKGNKSKSKKLAREVLANSIDNGKKKKSGTVLVAPKITKSSKKPKESSAAADSGAYIVIDHPGDGEFLYAQHYAVRIGASSGSIVTLSIDGGEWQKCRQTSGYYWYDWYNIPSGKHKLTARVETESGKVVKTKIVQCQA